MVNFEEMLLFFRIEVEVVIENFEIFELDDCLYCVICLFNGLEVFLVYDFIIDKVVVVVDVNVGSYSDEDDMLGMVYVVEYVSLLLLFCIFRLQLLILIVVFVYGD